MENMNKMADILKYFAMKYDGEFKKIYEALELKEKVDPELASELLPTIKYKSVTIIDENYPMSLKMENNPPFVLFYDGDISLMDQADSVVRQDKNGVRMISCVKPEISNKGMKLEYVISCENHGDMDMLVEHAKSKGIQFKDYNKDKENVR